MTKRAHGPLRDKLRQESVHSGLPDAGSQSGIEPDDGTAGSSEDAELAQIVSARANEPRIKTTLGVL